MSSDDGSGSASGLGTTPDISSLASGLASAEITPREERTFVLGGQADPALDLGIGETSSETPTRLLLVSTLFYDCMRASRRQLRVWVGPSYPPDRSFKRPSRLLLQPR